jgi:hypothetical protein
VADKVFSRADLRFNLEHEPWDYAVLLPQSDGQAAEQLGQKFVTLLTEELNEEGIEARPSHLVEVLQGGWQQLPNAEVRLQ